MPRILGNSRFFSLASAVLYCSCLTIAVIVSEALSFGNHKTEAKNHEPQSVFSYRTERRIIWN